MRFTVDSTPGINRIRSYCAGELNINETTTRSAVIVSATALIAISGIESVNDLTEELLYQLLALEPELVLLGTGPKQEFPTTAWSPIFLRRAIGFEVMNTAAACRTYTVLTSELRKVVALLIP